MRPKTPSPAGALLHAYRVWRTGRYLPGDPWPWLAGIVARGFLREARRRARGAVPLPPERWPVQADPRAGPHEAAEAAESARLVRGALTGLGTAHRTAVVLGYIAGLSEAEVAACCGLPRGTVKSLRHHARGRLASALPLTLEEVPRLLAVHARP